MKKVEEMIPQYVFRMETLELISHLKEPSVESGVELLSCLDIVSEDYVVIGKDELSCNLKIDVPWMQEVYEQYKGEGYCWMIDNRDNELLSEVGPYQLYLSEDDIGYILSNYYFNIDYLG